MKKCGQILVVVFLLPPLSFSGQETDLSLEILGLRGDYPHIKSFKKVDGPEVVNNLDQWLAKYLEPVRSPVLRFQIADIVATQIIDSDGGAEAIWVPDLDGLELGFSREDFLVQKRVLVDRETGSRLSVNPTRFDENGNRRFVVVVERTDGAVVEEVTDVPFLGKIALDERMVGTLYTIPLYKNVKLKSEVIGSLVMGAGMGAAIFGGLVLDAPALGASNPIVGMFLGVVSMLVFDKNYLPKKCLGRLINLLKKPSGKVREVKVSRRTFLRVLRVFSEKAWARQYHRW